MGETPNVGEEVTVTYGKDSARSPNKAIVIDLPPTAEKMCGEEITYDTKIKVQYVGGLQATEFVHPKQIE